MMFGFFRVGRLTASRILVPTRMIHTSPNRRGVLAATLTAVAFFLKPFVKTGSFLAGR